MGLFGPVIGSLAGTLGKEAQRKVAKLGYNVYRHKMKHERKGCPEWEDLTQRDQEAWMVAAWDAFQESQGRDPDA